MRFERRLGHPIARVWRALTEPGELAKWLALAELDLREGGAVDLTWQNTDEDGNTATARGIVSALDPPRLLELDTDIHGTLRWELEPSGDDGTLLTFTVDARLPQDYELEVLSGWHIHLDHLETVLDGGTIDWPHWDREHKPDWGRIRDRYAARAASGGP
jgi:uncharacterized protein YndB with AHSA1/START domain